MASCFQILISLQHFRYDVNSIDLMIRMGLVNVLIERLELKTKDMFEVHNTASGVRNDSSNSDTDDEMESTNPKRPKIDIDAVNFIVRVTINYFIFFFQNELVE